MTQRDKVRSPELVEFAVQLYAEVKSTQKVARRLGLGASTTYRLLTRAGVKMPGRHSAEVQEQKRSLRGEAARKAASDYESGVPLADLQKKYGVGAWAIKSASRASGVKSRHRGQQPRRFSKHERDDIVRLYNCEKWTQSQIAAKYKASVPMINRLCRALGLSVRSAKARGESHGSWKGGRIKLHGYTAVLIGPDDPMASMRQHHGYVLEHRLVMARALGRTLHKHETVHHIDGDVSNNALGNLQLRFGRHGTGVALKCRCCGSTDIIPAELH